MAKKTALDTNVTQAQIEEFLGLDRRVFHAAVYRAQEDVFDFANATDAAKKELLSRIIPELGEVDRLKDEVKRRIAEVSSEEEGLKAERAGSEHRLQVLQAADWGARKAEWSQQHAARLSAAQTELQQAEAYLASLGEPEDVQALQHEVTRLQNNPPTDLSYAARQTLDAHDQSTQALFGQLQIARNEAQQANMRRQSLNTIGEGVCSRCFQTVTGDHLEKEKQAALAVQQQKDKARDLLEAQYQAKTQERAALKTAADNEDLANRTKMENHQKAIYDQQSRIQQAQQLQTAKQQAEMNCLRRKGAVEVVEAETWPGVAEQAASQQEASGLTQKLADLDQTIYHLAVKRGNLVFWEKAFGLKGLKSLILDARLQDMTDAANEWVKILTGGTHWVRFESQTMSRSGKLSENVNVRVLKYNTDGSIADRNYKSYSGGEKKRISLGIDWGLSTLVASRAQKTWGLYVIDESFRQHIDSGGRESIFELLALLQKERSSIFVIDHDQEMQSHFESTITIRRQNQRAEIVE